MKIALFGASGMIGSRILTEALARGHQVTGIVRQPEKITTQHPHLTVQQGDAQDAANVAQLVAGHDAVISAVVDRTNPVTIIDVAKALIEGVRQAGLSRLITIGGAGSLEIAPGVSLVDTPDFPEPYRLEASSMRDALNIYRSTPDVNWTFICPAIIIMPGERTGKFRVGIDQPIFDAEGNSTISAEDFAIAVINELEQPQYSQQRFTVGY